jgi:hypothetical protein
MSATGKIILWALTICLFSFQVEAVKGPISVNVDVPAGEFKAVRLKNLPRGAFVAIEVQTEGEVEVVLTNTEDYTHFLDVRRPLFRGRVNKKLSFSVSIPESDNYFLIFYNRYAKRPRTVTATIMASRDSPDDINAAGTLLSKFEQQLHRLFIFESFPMGVAQCPKSRAFDESTGVTLCAEYIQILYKHLSHKQKAQDALSFSIFHEVSRVLLTQWHHPGAGQKTIADEMAAALMIMFKQKEKLFATIEHFSQNPSISKKLQQALEDDRHPLTTQRTEKLETWLKDSRFVLKWQKFLVPHMQLSLLKRLQAYPTEWTDLPLVEKELAARDEKVL